MTPHTADTTALSHDTTHRGAQEGMKGIQPSFVKLLLQSSAGAVRDYVYDDRELQNDTLEGELVQSSFQALSDDEALAMSTVS